MTSKNVNEENFSITWNRIQLSIIGAWPRIDDKDGRISNFISFLAAMNVLLFITLPQTAFVFEIWPDLNLISESLSLANFPVTIGVLKLFAICNNRQALRELIVSIYDDWNCEKSEFNRKIMKSNANVSLIITLYCVLGTMSAVLLFLISEVYFNLSGIYPVRQWLYLSYFPFHTTESPTYELIILFQFTGGFCSGLIYGGIISFCGMLILHLHGQFEILQFTIEEFINTHEFQTLAEYRSKLKIFVIQHEHLNRFAITIEETFNKVLLLELLVFTAQLCLQGYLFLTIFRSRRISCFEYIFWLAFVFTILSNLFVICFLGEKLENTSVKLQGSIQKSKWYNLTATESIDLMMLVFRTNNPLKITAGKFCSFSFETFMAIIKKSFAFMSVLLTTNQNVA
ncbi:odorant receptor 4-like [Leptopilina boulardi]|uniref:odorant receptor 4-like n=1 Tax=Leptopilina boulardi TaxID=63433 RepID=UPI0021F4FF03|nr:odorant receptor 4-like [Leptopilina boulardi]